MSAKDRAERSAKTHEQRFISAAMEGLRQCLNSPDGRAFLWWLYSENADADGDKTSRGRRVVAREVLRAARLADFEALQIMREEWEKPRLPTLRGEAEAEGPGSREGEEE